MRQPGPLARGGVVVTLLQRPEEAQEELHEGPDGHGEERQLPMAPSQLQAFIQTVRERFDEASAGGSMPVLLASPLVRPYVRSIIERFRPLTPVMSQNEIHPSIRLRTMGQI